MRTKEKVGSIEEGLLRLLVALYGGARLCQLCADRLPFLITVTLHVVPPALFAFIHGRVLYGAKGVAVFAICCPGIGGLSESISLRTGFPFGSYFFTGLMGPRLFDVPFLLILAYLGIAYCSWVLALLLSGPPARPFQQRDLFFMPVLASSIFLSWDLAMEADWSIVDRAWIWRMGGPFFGVPLSNFAGWFATAWTFYMVFAIYSRRHRRPQADLPPAFWQYAVALFALCAAGNLLIPLHPMAPPVVMDATGKAWHLRSILLADSAVSIFVMGGISAVAWGRSLRQRSSRLSVQ